MKISIIVPVYNVENYIKECLNSLVNQRYKNIEIICVNDGSTDNSLNILKEYEKKYKGKIKVYSKKNGGLSDTRNFGIDKATGDYVGFVDSDDWVSLDMFKDMIYKAVEEKSDVVVCDYTEIYAEFENRINETNMDYKMLYETLVCNKLFKLELFKKNDIKFPVGVWYEDNATTYKLLYLAKKVSKINKSYYFYRRTRAGSIMNSQKSKKIYDMYTIGDNLYDFFNNENLSELELEEIEYIFVKNVFFRQIPKIIKLEMPNIIKIQKKINNHFEYLDTKYPNWQENRILIEDRNNYFKNKIGENHIKKVNKLRKSFLCLFFYIIELKIRKR